MDGTSEEVHRESTRIWRLLHRGVAAGTISVLDDRDGGTPFEFTDPDGNAWVVQQLKAQGGETP